MIFEDDFVDFIKLLNHRHVEYMVVGAHALAFHGRPRHFDEAYAGKIIGQHEDLDISFINLSDFIANKLTTGRAKDLGDIDALKKKTGDN